MRKNKGWIDLGGIIFVLCVVAACCLLLWALDYGLSQTEKAECLKWQKEAGEYPQYYIVDWQKKQCETYGVEINAPIH